MHQLPRNARPPRSPPRAPSPHLLKSPNHTALHRRPRPPTPLLRKRTQPHDSIPPGILLPPDHPPREQTDLRRGRPQHSTPATSFYFELVGGRPPGPSYAWLREWPAFQHLRNVNIQFWELGGEDTVVSDAPVLRRRLQEICAILCLAPSLERVTIAVYDWRRFDSSSETFAKLLETRRDDWRSVLTPLASLPEQLAWGLETPIVVAWNLKGDGGRIVAEAVGRCVEDIMGSRGAEKKEL